MKYLAIALAVLCLCAYGAKKKKPQEIRVLDVEAHRSGGLIRIDGHIQATGEKPISEMVVAFDFLDSDRTPLVTKKAPIDEPVLETGDEAAFHVETDCPPRAIGYRVRAFKAGGGELDVENAGPFTIL